MLAEEHKTALEGYASRLLRPYLERLGLLDEGPGPKDFNDPVWGTMTLRPLEVVILDSPLLQRLRRIRQLGVVHLVYPGATHTRLEHSLGVVHQVQRMINAFNEHYGPDKVLVNSDTLQMLRLIALCHDVGHGFMSHVSENALHSCESVEDLIHDFATQMGVEKPRLGEVNSYYLIGSPAFRELLERAQSLTHSHVAIADFPEKMQLAVIGKPIDDDVPLLHELISGPFDADKLDYMPRDALMTGVPVVTDVNRLVQKLRAIDVNPEELPEDLASRLPQDVHSYKLTGIARSGNRTLDELTLARTLTFDKVYRHHKVRAVEAMVASILKQFETLAPDELSMAPFQIHDDGLLDLELATIERVLGRTLPQGRDRCVKVAEDMSRRIAERDLLVRALAFARKMPSDAYDADPAQQAGLDDLIKLYDRPQERRKLEERIADETDSLLELDGATALLDAFPERSLADYIWIDPPRPPENVGVTSKALLMASDRKVLRFDEDAPETPRWASAYNMTRDVGYVFSPRPVATYVFVAAERVLLEEYKIKLPSDMLLHAQGNLTGVEKLRTRLGLKGYFSALPHTLRPLPPALRPQLAQRRIGRIRARLYGYAGPAGSRTEIARSVMHDDRIRDWLRQFEEDEFIEEAFLALEQLMVLGRETIAAAVKSFLDSHPDFVGSSLAVFGSGKDSSSVVTYYANDLAADYELHARPLDSALLAESPILFVDDFVYSGRQAAAIISAWMGEHEPAKALGEDRDELAHTLRERFRRRRVGFCFATGFKDEVAPIKEALTRHGFERPEVSVYYTDLPRLGSVEAPDRLRRERFGRRLEGIGRELLRDMDPAKAEDRVLGYGNQGLLLTFPYNTPAQTLTALWAAGEVGGVPWEPLLPRRKKH